MFKIGCVNIDTSHPNAFAGLMQERNLEMRYTAIYNDGFRSDAEVKTFMDNHGVETRYDCLKSMAEVVDAAFIHDCNWEKHIGHAMPFIEAGKPVFLDKPIVGSLKDCCKLLDLTNKGAKIIGSSSARYAKDLLELKEKIASDGETVATIFGTAGADEFNYGVHIMEALHGFLGSGVYSTRFLGVSNNGSNPCEQYLVKWNSGIQVIYQTQTGQWQPFVITVTTDKNIHQLKIDSSKMYIELLTRIEKFLKTGKNFCDINDLAETVKIYLAGKKSRECGGVEIPLQSLRLDDPGFDGYAFEESYRLAAQRR